MTRLRAVEGLELVEPRPVDHPGQHLPGVEGHLGIGRRDPEQLVGIVDRPVGGLRRARSPLAPVQASDDLATQPDGVDLVDRQVVGQARHPGVHGGTAQLLVGGLLTGGHLHQRRPTQEHLRPLFDHHDVVAHAGHVGAAGGGVAEHDRHRRDGGRRVAGDVPERPSTRDEQLGLGRKVGPARFGEADRREPVGEGDVRAAGPLAERPRVHRPAPHRGVGGVDQALDPLDHADAQDGGGPDRVLGAPGGEGAQLEERRVAVEEELHPLAGGHLAPLPVPGHVALAPTGPGHGQLGLHQVEAVAQGALVGGEGVGTGVDGGGEYGHVRFVPRWGRWRGTGSHCPGRRGKNRPMTHVPCAEPRTAPPSDRAGVAPW